MLEYLFIGQCFIKRIKGNILRAAFENYRKVYNFFAQLYYKKLKATAGCDIFEANSVIRINI